MVVITRQKNKQNQSYADATCHLYQTILKAHEYLSKFNATLQQAQTIINDNPEALTTKVSIQHLNKSNSCSMNHEKNDLDRDYDGCSTAAAAILLESFQDETYSLPIHWVAKLGLTKMLEIFLSKDSSLLLADTGTKNKIPLHFVGKNEDAKHALIAAHPEYENLCKDFLECDGEPMSIDRTFHEAVFFNYSDIVNMFMDALPDDARRYILEDDHIWNVMEWEQEEMLLKFAEFDPTLVQNRHGGRLPLHWISNPEHYNLAENDDSTDLLLRFISYSQFYGLFDSIEIPRNPNIPPWTLKNTHWAEMMIIGSFPRLATEIFRIAAEKRYPLLNDTVGRLSTYEIVEMMNVHNVDTDMIDDKGRNLLIVSIHRACEPFNINYWKSYFKVLIVLSFMKQCSFKKKEEQRLRTFWNNQQMFQVLSILSGKKDKHNQYLIHILAKEGLSSKCVADFMNSTNCNDLLRADEETGLLPFMFAGIGVRSNLSTSYQMIRKRPDVLEMLRRDNSAQSTINSHPFSLCCSDDRHKKRPRKIYAV